MGKLTGFMEYERLEEGYAPVPQRLKHYKEFVIGLKVDEAKLAQEPTKSELAALVDTMEIKKE